MYSGMRVSVLPKNTKHTPQPGSIQSPVHLALGHCASGHLAEYAAMLLECLVPNKHTSLVLDRC